MSRRARSRAGDCEGQAVPRASTQDRWGVPNGAFADCIVKNMHSGSPGGFLDESLDEWVVSFFYLQATGITGRKEGQTTPKVGVVRGHRTSMLANW